MNTTEIKHPDNPPEDQTLKQLLLKTKAAIVYILKNWKIILLVSILGGGLGLLYSLMKKPTYIAVLTFAIAEDKTSGGGLSGALGLASSFGVDLGGSGGGAFGANNLSELMRSRSLVEKTLLSGVNFNGKPISLANYYLETFGIRKKWENDPKLVGIDFPILNNTPRSFNRLQDSILGTLYGAIEKLLSIDQKDKKITITTVQVTSGDEWFSKMFCEGLVREVSTFYIDTRSRKAQMNLSIIERQVDSIRTELNSAITGVAIANNQTYNLNPAYNIQRTPSSKRQVDIQANTAILIELVKNQELAKVNLRKETPLVQIIDTPIFPLKKERVGKLIGIVMGGFLFGFFAVAFLLFRRALNKLMI